MIKKHKRKKFTKEFRRKIFERDNYECQLCNPKKNLLHSPHKRRIDHKIPLSKGGTNDEENLWLVCDECDKRKKNKIYKKLLPKKQKVKLKSVNKNSLVVKNGNSSG
jgi:5-methylcytosine-specific restriction protein A